MKCQDEEKDNHSRSDNRFGLRDYKNDRESSCHFFLLILICSHFCASLHFDENESENEGEENERKNDDEKNGVAKENAPLLKKIKRQNHAWDENEILSEDQKHENEKKKVEAD